jgi:hypothetical protein
MKTNGGFIGKMILLIVAIIALKYYFHFDIVEFFKTPEAQKFIGPIWNGIIAFYNLLDTLVKRIIGID